MLLALGRVGLHEMRCHQHDYQNQQLLRMRCLLVLQLVPLLLLALQSKL
jgi:hypothetical protein